MNCQFYTGTFSTCMELFHQSGDIFPNSDITAMHLDNDDNAQIWITKFIGMLATDLVLSNGCLNSRIFVLNLCSN